MTPAPSPALLRVDVSVRLLAIVRSSAAKSPLAVMLLRAWRMMLLIASIWLGDDEWVGRARASSVKLMVPWVLEPESLMRLVALASVSSEPSALPAAEPSMRMLSGS